MNNKRKIINVIMLTATSVMAMFFINKSLAAMTGKVNTASNLRESASSDSTILDQLTQNQEVEIIEKEGNWYKVNANGTTGYVRQDLVNADENTEVPDEEIEDEQTNEEPNETATETESQKETSETSETADTNNENTKTILEK